MMFRDCRPKKKSASVLKALDSPEVGTSDIVTVARTQVKEKNPATTVQTGAEKKKPQS